MAEPAIAGPLSGRGRMVTTLPHFGRAILRCRDTNNAAISERLGLELPRKACRSTSNDTLHALWLGPDEWLLLAENVSSAEARVAGLSGTPCSAVDISHRQVALGVRGVYAEAMLNTGCPLDLAAASFPIGACARTVFHKAEIVIWRTGQDRFHVEVWRSFAPYVEALLIEAESE